MADESSWKDSRFVRFSLVFGLLLWGYVIADRLIDAPPEIVPFAVGSDLSHVRLADGLGQIETLEGERTVLLFFHSECAVCVREAGTWRELMPRLEGHRVFAVTPEEISVGRAFADEHGWDVSVRTIQKMTMRTPWFVVTGPDGSVEFEVVGSETDALLSHLETKEVSHEEADTDVPDGSGVHAAPDDSGRGE